MCERAGLSPAIARCEVREMAVAAPDAARAGRDELAGEGWEHPILDRVLEIVEQRAARLARIAA
jgi:hypothetical protein